MENISFDYQHIVDAQGIGLAITGMIIVFSVLTLISAFIAALPRMLAVVEPLLPPETAHHAPPAPRGAEEEELAAAIAFVLHQKRGTAP